MRQPSCIAPRSRNFAFFLILSTVALSASAQTPVAQTTPPDKECTAVVRTYGPEGCKITIDRDQPTTPLPVQVPRGTKVYVVVDNARPTETVSRVVTTEALPPPDSFGAFIKAIVTPLSTLVASTKTTWASDKVDICKSGFKEIDARLNRDILVLDKELPLFSTASDRMRCVQYGHTYGSEGNGCMKLNDETLGVTALSVASKNALDAIIVASAIDVSPEANKALLVEIEKARTTALSGIAEDDVFSCKVTINQDAASARLKDQLILDRLAKLKTAQTTFQTAYEVIRALPPNPPTKDSSVLVNNSDRKATVKLSSVDAITSEKTDLGTVVISWQYTKFVLSTGVLLSTLMNQSFANSPVIVNGSPVLDSSGKVITKVTMNATRPSIVFPLVMGNFRMPLQFCGGKCSVLLGGGIGANLSSKTADFAAGPSLQIYSVLLSPLLHYGRQVNLTNGVVVGQQLGTTPVTPPTNSIWKPAFGFAISYTIPLSAAASASK